MDIRYKINYTSILGIHIWRLSAFNQVKMNDSVQEASLLSFNQHVWFPRHFLRQYSFRNKHLYNLTSGLIYCKAKLRIKMKSLWCCDVWLGSIPTDLSGLDSHVQQRKPLRIHPKWDGSRTEQRRHTPNIETEWKHCSNDWECTRPNTLSRASLEEVVRHRTLVWHHQEQCSIIHTVFGKFQASREKAFNSFSKPTSVPSWGLNCSVYHSAQNENPGVWLFESVQIFIYCLMMASSHGPWMLLHKHIQQQMRK